MKDRREHRGRNRENYYETRKDFVLHFGTQRDFAEIGETVAPARTQGLYYYYTTCGENADQWCMRKFTEIALAKAEKAGLKHEIEFSAGELGKADYSKAVALLAISQMRLDPPEGAAWLSTSSDFAANVRFESRPDGTCGFNADLEGPNVNELNKVIQDHLSWANRVMRSIVLP